MDHRCPHCQKNLALRWVGRLPQKNVVNLGESALQCPCCMGAITFNDIPPDIKSQYRVLEGLGEFNGYIVLIVAWLIALPLSAYFPVWATVSILSFIALGAYVAYLFYLSNIKLAHHPAYRIAHVCLIDRKIWRKRL